MSSSSRPPFRVATDAPARRPARGGVCASTLAVALAAACVAAACGPSQGSDTPGATAGAAPSTDAGVPPGAYRMRARGVNVYRDTFPMAGVLRLDPARPRGRNATIDVDVGPDSIRGGAYEGSVRTVGDSVEASLYCEHCRVQTADGGNYVDLSLHARYAVRALGGGRYELAAPRAPGAAGRPVLDTLVRVDR